MSSDLILVLSHRGGCGKSAIATALCVEFGSTGASTLFCDYAYGAPAASLLSTESLEPWTAGSAPDARVSDRYVNLYVSNAAGRLGDAKAVDGLMDAAARYRCRYVVADVPTAGQEDLAPLLILASAVLVVVPCDGSAFRSLGPYLEMLNEERAKPRRTFKTMVIMSMTGVPNTERQAMEEYQRQFLKPLLAPTDFPIDPSVRQSMSEGVMFHPGDRMRPVHVSIEKLAVALEEAVASRRALAGSA